jgi:hypothetical protein
MVKILLVNEDHNDNSVMDTLFLSTLESLYILSYITYIFLDS